MTPIELGPIPDPEFPEGSQIGSSEGSSTSYERAAGELLHRPHAFALMHGDGGAKVAYGELHWRVDVITLQFKTSAIAVNAHPDHAHDHPHTHTTTSQSPTKSGPDLESTGGYYGGGSGYDTSTPDHCHDITHTHTISQPVSTDTTSGVKETDGSSSSVLTHTVTGQITYCSGAAQEEIGNITQQVPNVDTKDGKPMKAFVHGENNEDPYHQLSSYGDVYLVWEVDLEKGQFNEITNCWVQIGEPDPFAISSVDMGTSTTGRRDETVQDGSTEGTYHVKLGSVSADNKITQDVTSDVVWSPTVMDRVFAS